MAWITMFPPILLVIFSLTCSESHYFEDAGPLVKTTNGPVIGKYVTVFGSKITAFLGIPFAKPPIGDRRFRIPEPIDSWNKAIFATEQSKPCMQYSSRSYPWVPNGEPTEDCLYLNIWSPIRCEKDQEKLPVMIWIYGGGFYSGSTDLDVYDGGVLASFGNVIVASMNYRVGVFGFMESGTPEAPGNVALHDQSLAIKWIKENAQNFGGDPERITVFGESAGSIATSLHMISPLSKDLFHRAILQSGTGYQPHMTESPEAAIYKADVFAKALGCSKDDANITTDADAVVECLKRADAQSLAKTEDLFTSKAVTYFLPSYGNKFLPDIPISVYNHENPDFEVLIGLVKDEGTIFMNYFQPEIFPSDAEPTLNRNITDQVIGNLLAALPEAMLAELINFNFINVSESDGQSLANAASKIFGDYVFNCPAMFLAEKMNKAYFYWFTHRSMDFSLSKWLGAPHFYDVFYTFGDPIRNFNKYNPEDKGFSNKIINMWTSFARNGHPLAKERMEDWPVYSAAESKVFELNPRTENIISFPRKDACELWRPIFHHGIPLSTRSDDSPAEFKTIKS